jgi:hypothetical protein
MIAASKRKESGNLKIGIQGEDGLDVDLSDDDDEERKTPNLPATTPGVNPQGSFAVDKLDAGTFCSTVRSSRSETLARVLTVVQHTTHTRPHDTHTHNTETVNVYKNCHAVLFLMDPRKKWTFDYIERELPNVPKSTFVLILVRTALLRCNYSISLNIATILYYTNYYNNIICFFAILLFIDFIYWADL